MPTGAAWIVIAVAVAAMIVWFTQLDVVAHKFPNITIAQAKAVSLLIGLGTVGTGWSVLKLCGIPFSKPEES